MRLIAVAGTGTEVGKTFVAAALLGALRARGVTVSARKPAQSFGPGDGPTDADRLAAVTGERATDVCSPARWYPVPLAPPMAAERLGRRPPSIAELAGLTWPAGSARHRRRMVTGSTCWPPWRPTWWCWWPTPASAPST